MGAAAADHRPGLRGRAAARHVSGDAGGRAVAVARLEAGEQDIEPVMSHAAADVIFRTLFSIPIEDEIARRSIANSVPISAASRS
jgi:hypothetical protein